MFVRSAETGLAGTQGTVIGDAIQLAVQNAEEESPGALIIISDGEDHDSEALEAASDAARKGWQIFTVGVGTSEGGLIPLSEEGREEYKKDKSGQNVRSVPNTDLLKQLASQGNGQYFSLEDDPVKIIKDVSSYLDMVKKRSAEVRSYTQYNSYFQYFLAPAFLCFLGLVLFPYGYIK
jgi:Ca-activated chloride channel family protein